MGVFIHRSVLSWATVNIKDLMFTVVPWIPSYLLYLITGNFYTLLLPLLIYLYDAASLVFPNNILLSLYLTNKPAFYDASIIHSYVPGLKKLTDPTTFKKVQNELMSIPREQMPHMRDALPNQNYIGMEKGWRLVPLKTVGKVHERYSHLAPTLMNLISEMPEVCTVFFSRLEGNSFIPPHAGYLKNIVRYHIGISVPESEQCSITVNNIKGSWREGEALVFDDMYLHSVVHNGSQPRCVLWLDVLRPECKSGFLRMWSLWLIKKVAGSTWMNSVNERIEQVYKISHE